MTIRQRCPWRSEPACTMVPAFSWCSRLSSRGVLLFPPSLMEGHAEEPGPWVPPAEDTNDAFLPHQSLPTFLDLLHCICCPTCPQEEPDRRTLLSPGPVHGLVTMFIFHPLFLSQQMCVCCFKTAPRTDILIQNPAVKTAAAEPS